MEKETKVLVKLVHRSRFIYATEQFLYDYKEIIDDNSETLKKAVNSLLYKVTEDSSVNNIVKSLIEEGEKYPFMLADAIKYNNKIFVDTTVFDKLVYES